MVAIPEAFYRDLVGKPFLDGGRGPDSYDCWGILQELSRRLGKYPTDFPSKPALLSGALEDEWIAVGQDAALPGDGILLRSSVAGYQWHIGVVLDRARMLHSREEVGVCVERFDSPAYKRRIVGFYRYRGR